MKKVVIMSGVSGSGKSTYARKLADENISLGKPEAAICNSVAVVSADNYFMFNGEYRFDPKKLSEAHGVCFRGFIAQLMQGTELVIVDNTNTTTHEVSPYILGAQAYGWEVEIVTFMCKTDEAVEACANRNAHGVPLSAVQAMHRKLCVRELMPWWKNTTTYVG